MSAVILIILFPADNCALGIVISKSIPVPIPVPTDVTPIKASYVTPDSAELIVRVPSSPAHTVFPFAARVISACCITIISTWLLVVTQFPLSTVHSKIYVPFAVPFTFVVKLPAS